MSVKGNCPCYYFVLQIYVKHSCKVPTIIFFSLQGPQDGKYSSGHIKISELA